jgi:transcription elongation factor GreA
MERIFLTRERRLELKKELADLKSRGRKEIAERLKQAKELGDLSENSEFLSCREEQLLLEKRISQLEELIRGTVLIRRPKDSRTIKIGSTLKVQKDNQIFTYTLVGPEDSQPGKGLISDKSPLGKAFLGKKIGEVISVETPVGPIEYKILKIE